MADLLFTIACPVFDDPAAQRLVDTYRTVHDPQHALVPPHFTLLFGCADVDEAAYLRHVAALARSVPPIRFHARCAALGADADGERAHVYLVPDEGHAAIALLHDRLYGGPLAPSLRLRVPYTPHITLGSSADFAQARAWCDELNERGVDVAGQLTELTIGALADSRFHVLHRVALGACAPLPADQLTDHLRALELRRTQALVARDIGTARALHAPDYQLITPAGKPFDREGYLGAIESGALTYTAWECGPMQVRLGTDMAMLRYQARLAFPSGRVIDCWHTDAYERRGTDWVAVWSQATAVAPPG